MNALQHHELASIFPMMTEKEMAVLADDIKTNGLQNPIILHDGKILDGRNRYEACRIAGKEPDFVNYTGDDPFRFIISLNLHRRHLDESQRAVIASRVANMTPGRKWESNSADLRNNISQPEAARLFNVSERMIQTVKAIERDAPERIADIEAGHMTATKVYTLIKTEERKEQRKDLIAKMPSGKFAVIYADPPWQYSNSGFNESAESQYATMPTEDICKMSDEVEAWSTPETVLFLWATNPLLPDALEVMQAWGFDYKTNMAWIKDKGRGKGWFLQSKHELLLIGTRTNTPHPNVRPDSCFEADRGPVHSRKPVKAYEIIESMYDGAKLEMFCRNPRDGWEAHGNEL